MRTRKHARACDGCRLEGPARYRALLDRRLCHECFRRWMLTGAVPEPALEESPRW